MYFLTVTHHKTLIIGRTALMFWSPPPLVWVIASRMCFVAVCTSAHWAGLAWPRLISRSYQTLFQIELIIMDLISTQQETAWIIC